MKFKMPKCLQFDLQEIQIRAREIETGQQRPAILRNRVAEAIEHELAEQLFFSGGIEELPEPTLEAKFAKGHIGQFESR